MKVQIDYELKENEFQCKGCKEIFTMSMYARAQTGMGHEIIFTCDCTHKTSLS